MNSARLDDHLRRTAALHGEREAVVFGRWRWSWSELERRVDTLAGALVERGVDHRDRVALISTTRPEALVTYLAAARICAITAGLGPLYTSEELGRLLELSRPAVVVAQTRLGERPLAQVLDDVRPALGSAPVIAIGDDVPPGTEDLAHLTRDAGEDREPAISAELERRRARVMPDDGLLVVFTSGSTGRPKAALLSHRNVLSNIAVEVRELAVTAEERILHHLPIHHVGGATELAIPAVMTGATLVMLDHFRPDVALELIARERVTLLGQVPTMFVMEFALENFADYDLSSLRLAAVAGAAAPREVFQRMAQIAPRVLTGYGLTEVAGFVTYTAPGDDLETLATTVGRVAPEFELRIVDDTGEPLENGEVGEVVIRGECVMSGYLDDAAATAEALDTDGWLRTGDLGRLDERGYLTLVDRKREMFISGGYNVYPREIEAHLLRHPALVLAACLGRPDPVRGEVGVAFVTPRPGIEVSREEVLEHCRTGLAEHKLPREVEIRPALPLTALGKVDKQALRRELEIG